MGRTTGNAILPGLQTKRYTLSKIWMTTMNRYLWSLGDKRKNIFIEFYIGDRVRPTNEWYITHGVRDQYIPATIIKIDSNGYWLQWDRKGFSDIFKREDIEHE